ncbi:MAG: hypothetical protein LIO59_07340 [Oscillospiraceae bacterium]|nr:hypothetical protein [Oscillospiraceae bacterium]
MKKHLTEFSKIILCLVMLTYFVGLAFGMTIIFMIVKSGASSSYVSTALCGLFSYIGAPVAVAIAFYSYKAKAENVEKIRNGNTVEIPEERFGEE